MFNFNLQSAFFSKPTTRDLYSFFKQLSTYHRSGEPFTVALTQIAEYTQNETLRKAILLARYRISEEGASLADAFEASDVWPPFIAESLAAGEESGKLDDILREIGLTLNQNGTIERKISNAMLTPKIVFVFLLIGFMVLAAIVVPRFEETYASQRIPLPWFTQIVFFIVNLIAHFWYVFVAALVFGWINLRIYLTKNPEAKDSVKLRLPFYRKLYSYILQYRFVKTFALLYMSGQSVQSCFLYSSRVVNNLVFGSVLRRAADRLDSGLSAAEALRESDGDALIHPMTLSLFASGEKAGRMDQSLADLAIDYEEDIKDELDRFSTKVSFFALLPGAICILILYACIFAPQVGLFAKKVG